MIHKTKAAQAGAEQIAELPVRFALHPILPNPFRSEASVRFDLAHESHVRLVLYDAGGRQVTVLADAILPPGQHARLWSSRDGIDRPLGAGVYLARIEARVVADGALSRAVMKMVLLP